MPWVPWEWTVTGPELKVIAKMEGGGLWGRDEGRWEVRERRG